jgi:hypothetical protein
VLRARRLFLLAALDGESRFRIVSKQISHQLLESGKNAHVYRCLDVLQKKLRIQSAQERDLKYLEASYNLLATKYYSAVPYASPKAIETSLAFIAADEPKARGADAKLFVDESIVRELEASGFIKTLYETEYRQ